MSTYVGAALLAVLPSLVLSTLFLVVVAVWSRGRVRLLGVVAGAVMVLQGVLSGVAQVVAPTLVSRLDLPTSSVSAVFLGLNLFGYVGTALIAAALVIGGRAEVRSGRLGGGLR